MALLSDLPNEITLMILGLLLLSPADFESFVSTCWRIYRVAGAHLDIHRALKREHGEQRFGDPEISGSRSRPSYLLAQIFREPHRALYVREISIDRWPVEWYLEQNYELRQGTLSFPNGEEITARLGEVVPNLVPGDDLWKSLRLTKLRDEDSVITLLLWLLPKISTLKLNDTFISLNYTVRCIAMMKGRGTPLSYLRHAQISDMSLLCYMAALPSMTSIHGLAINLPEPNRWPEDLVSPTSNVKQLVFTRCSIYPKRLFGILTAFKELRSFTYVSKDPHEHSHDESQEHRAVMFDPFWLCAGLSAHTSSTLESLTLISRNEVPLDMGDIRGLKHLRNLHTESQLVPGGNHQYCGNRSLAKVLPPKLETLKLECSGFEEEIRIARHISTLAKQKKEYVPALRKVEVITRNGVQDFNTSKHSPPDTRHHAVSPTVEEDYTHEAILKACKRQGFDLLVKAFDPEVIRSYNL